MSALGVLIGLLIVIVFLMYMLKEQRKELIQARLDFLEELSKERHAYGNALQVAIASNDAIKNAVDRLTMATLRK